MRSLWKGTISFGLVTIPVRLYAATEEKAVRFHYLHGECKTPVRYVKWCPRCGREVAMDEIVRGYEYEPDRYVVLTDADLERLPAGPARTVEILSFVDLREIDPVYFMKTYYLEPGEGGGKAYALLRRALQETGRMGVARVVLRGRTSLAGIRVYQGEALALETMHFPDEVRPVAALNLPAAEPVREQELELAKLLISHLAGPFVPGQFEDPYRTALLQLIQEKVAGEQVYRVEAPAPTGRVLDLLEALRQSVRMAEAARERVAAAGGAGPVPVPPAGGGLAAPAGRG